jgi:fibronectin type 3 domain-containing protein
MRGGMKKRIIMLLFIFLTWPGLMLCAAEVPQNVTLSATVNTITVTWSLDSLAENYFVYWDTSSGSLNNRAEVDGSENRHIISGLEQSTTYYVAVSSFSAGTESQKSSVKSIATTQDTLAPDVPTGLSVIAQSAGTVNSVTLRWNANSETDLSHYNVYWGTASGIYDSVEKAAKNQATSFTVTGLTESSRYYFAVTALDESENESDTSDEIIVDTLPDTRPPFIPSGVSGRLSGFREITVRIENGNTAMVDFAGHFIHYGIATGRYTQTLDIGKSMSHVFTDMADDTTWFFIVTAYDASGNESDPSPEVFVEVEDTVSFLDAETFDGGCFISSAGKKDSPWQWRVVFVWAILMTACVWINAKTIVHLAMGCFSFFRIIRLRTVGFLLIAVLFGVGSTVSNTNADDKSPDNIAGVAGGWLIPAESDFEDYYGDDTYPVFAFFERRFGRFLSVGIESGFMKKTGNRMTVSGDPTDIVTKFTLVPVTAFVKLHMELFPYIHGFIGAGPDYWYCREKTKINVQDAKIEEWVGGWHGRAGLTLYNMDPRYEGSGAVIEAVYSEIDRFGENSRDIGGVTLRLGLFYGF